MRGNIIYILLILVVLLGIDFYVFQGVRTLLQNSGPTVKRLVYGAYWLFSLALIAGIIVFFFINGHTWSRSARTLFIGLEVFNLFPKLFFMLFIMLDDLQRLVRWVGQKFFVLTGHQPAAFTEDLSRADFLIKTGAVVATVPLVSISYGIMKGAHDYKIRRVPLPLKNLPSSFHGLKIAQISDIHTGSFYSKTAVKGGVEMLLREKPDMVFFTGDLVNEVASEVKDYTDVFSKVKAPLGVFSTLGNHDYGDYVQWESAEAKRKNLQTLMAAHKYMGWDLLMNEHRFLSESGDKLAIIGVENWGAGKRWPKYGQLQKAVSGTDDTAVKLLLSHDPSHWDAQIRPMFKDIDVTFAGHTHGCQFGVELGHLRWSPAQYFYKHWAGLYQEDNQLLYVNRGYGYIGFPGRIGMPPEITVFELVKA
jgi:uncharacterized protein